MDHDPHSSPHPTSNASSPPAWPTRLRGSTSARRWSRWSCSAAANASSAAAPRSASLSVAGVCAAAIVSVNVLSRPADHGQHRRRPTPTTASPVDDGSGRHTARSWSSRTWCGTGSSPTRGRRVSFLNGTADADRRRTIRRMVDRAPAANNGKATACGDRTTACRGSRSTTSTDVHVGQRRRARRPVLRLRHHAGAPRPATRASRHRDRAPRRTAALTWATHEPAGRHLRPGGRARRRIVSPCTPARSPPDRPESWRSSASRVEPRLGARCSTPRQLRLRLHDHARPASTSAEPTTCGVTDTTISAHRQHGRRHRHPSVHDRRPRPVIDRHARAMDRRGRRRTRSTARCTTPTGASDDRATHAGDDADVGRAGNLGQGRGADTRQPQPRCSSRPTATRSTRCRAPVGTDCGNARTCA